VRPLPYDGMPGYPYDEARHRPADPGWAEFVRTWLTREPRPEAFWDALRAR
jgi:hypothetical protein